MIKIIDSGLGNTGSILNMIRKVGHQAEVINDPNLIADAEKLILPGVGSYDEGIKRLAEKGFVDALNAKLANDEIPVLGICLGMQLLAEKSEEGNSMGLGWIPGYVSKLRPENQSKYKIPHMGWNTISNRRQHPLLADFKNEARFYFVHSYHFNCTNSEHSIATTTYGNSFTSIVAKKNIMGVQFHPEKSHRFGMQLLKNFATI